MEAPTMTFDTVVSQEDAHEKLEDLPEEQQGQELEHPEVEMDEEEEADYPLSQQQVISQISMSMEWLTDLRDTVARRGVSSHDMKALREIRGTLADVGIELAPTPALEHYPIGSYTSDRSSVNLDVGLESISRTIVETVKLWIRKLVEYIKKMYRWVKQHLKSEDKFTPFLERYQELFMVLRDAQKRLKDASAAGRGREYDKAIERALNELIKDSQLKRSPLQLALLGEPDQAARLRTLEKDAFSFTQTVERQVDEIDFLLGNSPQRSTQVNAEGTSIAGKILQEEIDIFTAEMPQGNYLQKHVAVDVLGTKPIPSVSVTLSPYDYLMVMHEELTKQLNNIRNIDIDDSQVDKVSGVLGDLSKNVDYLVKLASFFHNTNRQKVVTLKKLVTFEMKALNALYKDVTTNAVDTRQAETFERIYRDVEAKLKKEGIR